MPATVSTTRIHPLRKQGVWTAVDGFYKKFPDDWTVSILGDATNDAWKLIVKSPDGREQERMLHGHGGGHDIENILRVLEEITAELDPREA